MTNLLINTWNTGVKMQCYNVNRFNRPYFPYSNKYRPDQKYRDVLDHKIFNNIGENCLKSRQWNVKRIKELRKATCNAVIQIQRKYLLKINNTSPQKSLISTQNWWMMYFPVLVSHSRPLHFVPFRCPYQILFFDKIKWFLCFKLKFGQLNSGIEFKEDPTKWKINSLFVFYT